MELRGADEETIFNELNEVAKLDVPYERVLSSMCTAPHPIAAKAHADFIRSNLGDPKLFPGTSLIERKCIQMLGELLHLPDAVGYITTGGTESNIQAMRTAIQLTAGRVDRSKASIIIPESSHYSFDKAAQLLGLRLKRAPLTDDLKVDPYAMAEMIDQDTIAMVAVAGTTEFGQIDPIKEIGKLAVENDLYLHVDAAFGGFVIPFLECSSKYLFDFEVEGVQSITIDPHKMGMSTIPSGGLLYRNACHMKVLEINAQYLTSQVQSSLAGTRSGASAAATYAVMRYLGKEGYEHIVSRCMENSRSLYDRLADMGLDPVIDPVLNIVTFFANDAMSVRRKLAEKGWYVSTTRDPVSLRMVVMPHVTEEAIISYVSDLERVLE